MEHLDLVLWLCLFPLTDSITKYIDIKAKILLGITPQPSPKRAHTIIAWIWLIVGIVLFIF